MLPRCLAFCVLLLTPALSGFAQAAPSRVHFGRNISLSSTQSFHSIICYLCSASVQGSGSGNVVVFAGNAFIDGIVGGRVVVFGGNVTLTAKAVVGKNVVIVGGHLTQDQASSVPKHTVISPIIFLPVILVLALAFGGLILLTRRMVRGPIMFPPLPRL